MIGARIATMTGNEAAIVTGGTASGTKMRSLSVPLYSGRPPKRATSAVGQRVAAQWVASPTYFRMQARSGNPREQKAEDSRHEPGLFHVTAVCNRFPSFIYLELK